MQENVSQPFSENATPVSLQQLFTMYQDQQKQIDGLLHTISVLTKAISTDSRKGSNAYLPTYPGVIWDDVAKRFPKLVLDVKSAQEYLKQRLRLDGEPSLKQLTEMQQKLPRHAGVHWKELAGKFGCTNTQALAFIWFLQKAGLAKKWLEKDHWCRTDLEYVYKAAQ